MINPDQHRITQRKKIRFQFRQIRSNPEIRKTICTNPACFQEKRLSEINHHHHNRQDNILFHFNKIALKLRITEKFPRK